MLSLESFSFILESVLVLILNLNCFARQESAAAEAAASQVSKSAASNVKHLFNTHRSSELRLQDNVKSNNAVITLMDITTVV